MSRQPSAVSRQPSRSCVAAALSVTGAFVFSATTAHATQVEQLPLATVFDLSAFVGVISVLKIAPDAIPSDRGHSFAHLTVAVDLALEDAIGDWSFPVYLPVGLASDTPIDIVHTVGAPMLLEGRRYVTFFVAGPWVDTPFANWWHTVFEVADINGKIMWIAPDGRCVADVTDAGYVLGPVVDTDSWTQFMAEVYGEYLTVIEDGLGAGETGVGWGCADGQVLLDDLELRLNQHFVQRPRGINRMDVEFISRPVPFNHGQQLRDGSGGGQ